MAVHKNLRQRAGAVQQLAMVMPRGKLLTEIARSLVVGKLQTYCWIKREARLTPSQPLGEDIMAQQVMNDLARSLLGVKRSDGYRIELRQFKIFCKSQLMIQFIILNRNHEFE